jgi:hypothetical protein
MRDPEEFNDWARTPQNMEITLAGFSQEWECQTAKESMEREAAIHFRPRRYVCIYDKMLDYTGRLDDRDITGRR